MNVMTASNMKIRQKCLARNHSEFQNLKKKLHSKTTCKYCQIDKGNKNKVVFKTWQYLRYSILAAAVQWPVSTFTSQSKEQ